MTIETRPATASAARPLAAHDLTDLLAAYQYHQGRNSKMAAGLSAALGIGPADLHVLLYLNRMPDATPKEVAAQLEMTSGSVTSLLDRLESSGHIERIPHPTDRRSTCLRLTDSGAGVVRSVHGAYRDAFDGVFSPEELGRAAEVLRALGGALAPAIEALRP